MAYYQIQYVKNGAVFANRSEAAADKDSMMPPELLQEVIDCHAKMVEDGVLLRPIWLVWNPATYTLTSYKSVSSYEAYDNAVTFDRGLVRASIILAGWTPSNQEPVEDPLPPGTVL